MDRLKKLNKINFLWLDEKNELNNKKYLPILNEKFQNKFSINFISNLKDGIEELKKIKFQHCYVILSASYFQNYIDIIREEGKDLKCIPFVFVFTSDRTKKALKEGKINKGGGCNKEETLNYVYDKFFNRGGIFSGIMAMSDRIVELEKENNININNCDNYRIDRKKNNEDENLSNKDLNQKMFTFEIKSAKDLVLPSLYSKDNIYREKNKINKKDFLNFLMKQDYFEKTLNGIIHVNELIKPFFYLLDVQNFPEHILIKYLTYIYSLQTKFYSNMTHHLSTKREPGIYETFISLMYRGLNLDVFANDKNYSEFTLYRAQLMNKEEIKKIKDLLKNKNDSLPSEILFSNSFLSFTYKEEVYHKFFKENKNNELVNVLFEIEKGEDLDFTCQADLDGLSKYYKEEFEILFFPFSCFTIESIDENYNDYIFQNKTKKNIVVTKIKLNYLGKYKETIKKEIKTINIDEYMLNLKDDDFYKELKKFNVIENLDGKKIFDSKIKNIVGIKKSSIINEEFINKLKDTLLSNIIVIKSNKLIENNKDNFYAYSDKINKKYSFIIQNINKNNIEKNNENNNNNNKYELTDEYSNSMINYIYELKDGRILLCCFDNQIKIIAKNYAYNKFYYEQRLKNHQNLITNIIELSNGKLCSCSFDGTIKLWNKNDVNHYSNEEDLYIDIESIFYTIIEVSKNNIVSLFRNYKNNKKFLLIYSIENKKEIKKNIDGIELYNKNLIKIDDKTFAFGGTNKIYIFNLKGESVKELNLNFSVVCLCKLNNNSFVVSNDEGKLFLTDNFDSFDSFNKVKDFDDNNMNNKIISIEEFKDNTIIVRAKLIIRIFKYSYS